MSRTNIYMSVPINWLDCTMFWFRYVGNKDNIATSSNLKFDIYSIYFI